MMKKVVLFLIVLVMCLSAVGCGGKEREESNPNHINIINKEKELPSLAENGATAYKIVIPADAPEAIEYAAQELSAFVLQATDTALVITDDSTAVFDESNALISIGKTALLEQAGFDVDYSSMNIDGFIIRTVGNMIFINGANNRGTLYGVYDFLEKIIGVRFLTADATYVPQLSSVPLYEMNIVEIPDFTMRLYMNAETYHIFGSDAFMARSRQTTSHLLGHQEKFGEKAPIYARGELDHNMRYFVDQTVYNDPEKPETYHPEFFVHHPQLGTTICLTNGITEDGKLDESMDISVAKIVIEEMKEDIAANPDDTYFVFEQEDGWFYCECEDCQEIAAKYKRSGLLIRFMNVLNTEIKEWLAETDPGRVVRFVTFAYSYTLDAPVVIDGDKVTPIDDTVKARDEIVMYMAFAYNACYPYDHEKQAANLLSSIRNWKECASHFFYWVHDKDFYDYVSYAPFLKNIKQNVLSMKEYGVDFAMMQGPQNATNDWQGQLRAYVYRNLFWNSDLDAAALTQEFIDLYWGPEAAPFVTQFIESYENNYEIALKKNPDLVIQTLKMEYVNPNEGYISLNFLYNMVDILELAEDAINGNAEYSYSEKDVYLRRVAQLKTTPLGTLLRNYSLFRPSSTKEEMNNFYREYFDIVDYAGVSHYSETVTMADLRKSLGI